MSPAFDISDVGPAQSSEHSSTVVHRPSLASIKSSRIRDENGSSPIGPDQKPYVRFIILSLGCTVLVGNCYGYDLPAAISVTLQEHFGLEQSRWEWFESSFFSAYSLPNIFLPIYGGHLVDKYLTDSAWLSIFAISQLFGHLCFCIGLSTKSVFLSIIGRILFGIGGESLSVATSKLTTKYFRGKELAFALGVNFSVSKCGSVLNDVISPYAVANFGVHACIWMSLVVCAVSALMALALAKVDHSVGSNAPKYQALGGAYELREENSRETDNVGNSSNAAQPEKTNFFQSLRSFSPLIWIMSVVVLLVGGIVVPFMVIHTEFFKYRWYPNDAETAGQIMAIPDAMSVVLVPFFGLASDYIGRRPHIIGIASLLIGIDLFIIGVLGTATLIPWLILLGFAFSLVTLLFPCFPKLADKENTGAVFGLLAVVRNFGWTVLPMITAQLIVWDPTYSLALLQFSLSAFTGAGVTYAVWKLDRFYNGTPGILEKPEFG